MSNFVAFAIRYDVILISRSVSLRDEDARFSRLTKSRKDSVVLFYFFLLLSFFQGGFINVENTRHVSRMKRGKDRYRPDSTKRGFRPSDPEAKRNVNKGPEGSSELVPTFSRVPREIPH